MIATLVRTEDVAAGIKTFWLKPERPMQYVAGEYTQLHLPHPDMDDRGDKRWFTLSSSPTEPLIAITTKFAAGRSSSFKRTLRRLQPGVQIYIASPMGDFVLPKDPHIPLIFVAAGMGITPVRSMMKYLLDSGEVRDVQLFYAAHDEAQLAFHNLLKEYAGARFIPLIKQPGPDWAGQSGRLETARILEVARANPGALVYLSGPEVLVETWDKELKEGGIDPGRLVTDFFHGYPDI